MKTEKPRKRNRKLRQTPEADTPWWSWTPNKSGECKCWKPESSYEYCICMGNWKRILRRLSEHRGKEFFCSK